MRRRAAEVEDRCAAVLGPCGGDEDSCGVGRVLKLAAPAPAHLVTLASGGGLHRQRRICGQALISPRPVDDVRAEADTADAVVLEIDVRRSLVCELEDSVERRRLTCVFDPRPGGGAVDGRRARVGDATDALPLGRFEDIGRSDDVDGRASGWIGLHKRDEHRGEVNDVCDAVLSDRPLEVIEIGDVAVKKCRLLQLVGRHDQLEPLSVRAEVVQDHRHVLADELRARPGADAPERTGDQEAFVPHTSW